MSDLSEQEFTETGRSVKLQSFKTSIGREENTYATIDQRTLDLIQATLNTGAEKVRNSMLFPLWHWCFFPPIVATADLGPDGHPIPGGLIPDFGLPRRMWAGGRLAFHVPIAVGDTIRRQSKIKQVIPKKGKSGKLYFVTLEHIYLRGKEICIHEEQDIVYREAFKRKDSVRPLSSLQRTPQTTEEFTADPVLLFRYSALTFNSHRIHYDRQYCTEVEGYAGLVVQGPLVATLLARLSMYFGSPDKLCSFHFRAMSPLFEGQVFTLNGIDTEDDVQLWACGPDGDLAMSATAAFV